MEQDDNVDNIRVCTSLQFYIAVRVDREDRKWAGLVGRRQDLRIVTSFVWLVLDEYFVSDFEFVMNSFPIFLSIVCDCILVANGFQFFPVDDDRLAKEHVATEGQLSRRVRFVGWSRRT